MDAQAPQRLLQDPARHAVVGALELQKAAKQGLLVQACMIDQVLQSKNLVHRGQPWPEPHLHGRAEARTLGVDDQVCVEECRKEPQLLADCDGRWAGSCRALSRHHVCGLA